MTANTNTPTIGRGAEDAALAYLRDRGLELLVRNFRCKMGEIDLIMQDGNTLTFVEVRLRQSTGYHSGAESISHTKIRKLVRTAEYYLNRHQPAGDFECRFDVVSMGTDIDWIPNAFTIDDQGD